MSLLQALVLGVVQGLTEFLPISSTAHLILVPWILGWEGNGSPFVFDVLVQLGSLLAVVVYFRRDLRAVARETLAGIADRKPLGTPGARLGWWLVLGTLPGVAAGLGGKPLIEDLHRNPVAVAWILLFASGLLLLGERLGKRLRKVEDLKAGDALFVGFAQALAVLPGVSRSAATIAGGLLRGLDREAAARFSFLLSIPILSGAGAVALRDLLAKPDPAGELAPLAAGFVAAAVVGFASIHWLLRFLARRTLNVFIVYRVLAAVAMLLFALVLREGT